jgi:hypothetical protein
MKRRFAEVVHIVTVYLYFAIFTHDSSYIVLQIPHLRLR